MIHSARVVSSLFWFCSLLCKTVKYKLCRQSYIFKVWLEYLCTLEATLGRTVHRHRVAEGSDVSAASPSGYSFTIHIFHLYLVYLAATQLSLFTVQCNLIPTQTASCIKTHTPPALEISAVFMGDHKKEQIPPPPVTKYLDQYKTKGNRHEMHSIKWVVHVVQESGEQMIQRDRERNSQRNEQRSCICRLPQNKSYIC